LRAQEISEKRVAQGPVFLSYRSTEVDFALRLAVDLKGAGVNLWMDRLDIKPGDDWLKALQNAVSNCAAVIPVLSPDYVASRYCEKELARADRMGKEIFPVVIRDVPDASWPIEIQRHQYIDFRAWREEKTYREQFARLVAILKEKVADQVSAEPDAGVQQLVSLIAELESERGIIARLENLSSYSATSTENSMRPQPVAVRTWNLPGRFALVQPVSADDARKQVIPRRETRTPLTSFQEALNKFPRFILVSGPGAGKSTVLQQMVLETAHTRRGSPVVALVPLLLNLAEWGAEQTLEDFVRANWTLDFDPFRMAAKGKLIVFLDGLNEMGNTAASKAASVRTWLNGDNAPQRLIVTCRKGEYSPALDLGLPVIEIADLSPDHVREYALHFLGEVGARSFLESVYPPEEHLDRATRHIQQMARNPFLLSALLVMQQRQPNEPLLHSTGSLMAALIKELWTTQPAEGQAVAWEKIEAALVDLAFQMVDADMPPTISVENALEFVSPNPVLESAINVGLLDRNGETVRFANPFVQDYFAAIGLKHIGLPTRLTRPQFDHHNQRVPQRWDSAMLMLAGIVPNADSVVLNIAEVDPYLALACAVSGIEISDLTFDRVVNQLLTRLKTEGDLRVPVARIMLPTEPEKAALILMEAMRDGSWTVRLAAAAALTGGDLPLKTGLATALRELEDNTREMTSAALRQFGKSALPTLFQLIWGGEAKDRRGAAWALGEMKENAGVPLLLEALRDPEDEVALDAATALGRIKDPASIPLLMETLEHQNMHVGRAAARALGWLGKPARDTLLQALSDSSSSTKKQGRVIQALAHIADPTVAAALLNTTRHHHPDVRGAAVESLKYHKSAAAVKRLIECLHDDAKPRWSRNRISDTAAIILEYIGTEEAIRAVESWRKGELPPPGSTASTQAVASSGAAARDRLMSVTGKTSSESVLPFDVHTEARPVTQDAWEQRRDVAAALAHGEPDQVLPRLREMLLDEESQVRVTVVQSLGTLPAEPDVLAALVDAMRDTDVLVVDAAAEMLKRMARPPVPGLSELLRDPDDNRRGAAIDVVGSLRDVSAIGDLIDCLGDLRKPWLSEDRICDKALRALELIDTPEAQEAVEQYYLANPGETANRTGSAGRPRDRHLDAINGYLRDMVDTDWAIRNEAAKQLREYAKKLRGLKPTAVNARLLEVLGSSNWETRATVLEALGWIGDKSVAPSIMPLLIDTQRDVRAMAIRVLVELGETQAIGGIVNLLADRDAIVREAAVESLGLLGDPRAVPPLLDVVQEDEPGIVYLALEALGRLKHETAVEPLIRITQVPDVGARWAACWALGQIADVRAIPALITALEDKAKPGWDENPVAQIAAEALVHFDTPEAKTALERYQGGQSGNPNGIPA
jgi:HEAT repeat protein